MMQVLDGDVLEHSEGEFDFSPPHACTTIHLTP